MDLFERWPGSRYADHARGNQELRTHLREIFATRTSAEWVEFGGRVNAPIAPVNTPKTLPHDPQFQARLEWMPADRLGADQLSFPVKFREERLPLPTRAPAVGEHTATVLANVCGYDDEDLAALRAAGAFGPADALSKGGRRC